MNTAETSLSIIIPAYNEEKFLPGTIDCINRAKEYLPKRAVRFVELFVIDNNSTDHTAGIARAFGAEVLSEPIHNIAKLRNVGAKAAKGDILVFVDADTMLPETLFLRIVQVMSNPTCIGGAVDTLYRPIRFLPRKYLQLWRLAGKLARMAQGATQFCRRDICLSIGGYDEKLYMGEDVDFYRRLRRTATNRGFQVCFIDDIRVIPSCRRFDQWPFWKTLIWTNPVIILFFRRWKGAWRGWYQDLPR